MITITKQGYQKTKLGWIPLDWEIKELGSLGVFLKGKGITKKELVEEGKPCIRYGEIYTKHDYFIKNFYSFINESTADSSVRIYKNDLLFAGSGETLADIGKCVALIDNGEVYAGGDIIIFREHNQDTKFLGFLFNQDIVNRQTFKLGQGNAVVHIYSRDIKQLKLPLPPLPEQKKIAKILSTWDTAISKTKALIQKKQTLKKGLMQVLLTGKVRFGEFVGEWEWTRISEICNTYSGGTPSSTKTEYYNGKIPWIRSGELNQKQVTHVYKYITEEGFHNSSAKMVEPETILIALYGATAGVVGISRIRAAINQAVLAVVANEKMVDVNYYYQLLQVTLEKALLKYLQGGQPNLSATIVKKLKIPLPPLPEQKKIAKVLSTCDQEIEKLNEELAELQAQKKGLMQQLLTGATRVNVEA